MTAKSEGIIMTISPRAIELAANALMKYDDQVQRGIEPGYLVAARSILEAAAPIIRADAGAKALREAAEASFDGLHSEPVHEWLYARARATAVRGEG